MTGLIIRRNTIHFLRKNKPSVKVNFAKRVSYPTLFVGSRIVCTDRATEIESIRESVDDGFKLAPKLTK